MSASTLKSWSFSMAMVFEECKYRIKLERIDKILDERPRPHADRGTAIHLEAEDFVIGKGPFTNNLRFFKDDLTALQTHYAAGRVTCEEEWAFDREWKPVAWKAREAWLRLKADATCRLSKTHLVVIDYKTGKRFGNEVKHGRQLQLYAMCTLLLHPEIDKVTCELWYFDQDEIASFVMTRKQLKKFLMIYDKLGNEITSETEFPPSPNIFSCKYCPYAPDEQGQCEFGVRKNGAMQQPRERVIDTSRLKPLKDFDASEFEGRV